MLQQNAVKDFLRFGRLSIQGFYFYLSMLFCTVRELVDWLRFMTPAGHLPTVGHMQFSDPPSLKKPVHPALVASVHCRDRKKT